MKAQPEVTPAVEPFILRVPFASLLTPRRRFRHKHLPPRRWYAILDDKLHCAAHGIGFTSISFFQERA
jgi:hypothetical protein